MKKNKNVPLNLRERSNSRIAFICSVAVLAVLVIFFHQLDYNMIQKPADQAKKEAAQKKAEAKKAANTPKVTTASVIAVGDNLYHDSFCSLESMNPAPGITSIFTKMSKTRSKQPILLW